jgi:hypothetical protein
MIIPIVPQVDLLIFVLEDLMGFRMVALIVVDKIRERLLNSLVNSLVKEQGVEEEVPTSYTDPEFYKASDARVCTVVDQRLLSTLVVFACIMARRNCVDLDLYSPIIEVATGDNPNDLMFHGKINLDNLIELASQAEVDHVVDFLLQDDVSLYRADEQLR